MKTVTAIGSIALDSLVLPDGNYPSELGGSASHFATSCAHFQNSLSIVGVVGQDFPQKYLEYFQARHIDTTDLVVAQGKTFHWKGQYERSNMDQAFTLDTQLNVFETFSPQISGHNQSPDFLFLGNIHPLLQSGVAQKVRGGFKILDTMNLWIHNTRKELCAALSMVDVLIFNETEAVDFTGEHSLIKAGQQVLGMGPSVVVIKRGGSGAMLLTADDLFLVPAYPVAKVFDPTGAGDSFAGGFVGYLSECEKIDQKALRKAVVYGNITGSINVESVGTSALANTTRAEIEDRFHKFSEMVVF